MTHLQRMARLMDAAENERRRDMTALADFAAALRRAADEVTEAEPGSHLTYHEARSLWATVDAATRAAERVETIVIRHQEGAR